MNRWLRRSCSIASRFSVDVCELHSAGAYEARISGETSGLNSTFSSVAGALRSPSSSRGVGYVYPPRFALRASPSAVHRVPDNFVTAKAGCRSEHRQRRWPEGRRAEGGTPGVNPEVLSTSLSLRQIRKKPLSGLFAYLAEREGFEPSIELLTLYTLSRGAPSTTRPSPRICLNLQTLVRIWSITGNRRDAKHTGHTSSGKAQDSSAPGEGSPSGFCSRLMRW